MKILTTGHWPNDQKDNLKVVIPREIQHAISLFNKFYVNKHQGRVLHWKINQGVADIRAIMGENNTKYEF